MSPAEKAVHLYYVYQALYLIEQDHGNKHDKPNFSNTVWQKLEAETAFEELWELSIAFHMGTRIVFRSPLLTHADSLENSPVQIALRELTHPAVDQMDAKTLRGKIETVLAAIESVVASTFSSQGIDKSKVEAMRKAVLE